MKCKPVTLDGVTYPSQEAAAQAYGCSSSAIRNRIKRGTLENTSVRLGKPVTIRGVTYRSMAAAAKALGVKPEAVYRAKRMNCLQTVGTNRLEVTLDGVTYKSVSEAARKTGVSYWNLRMIAYDQRDLKKAS